MKNKLKQLLPLLVLLALATALFTFRKLAPEQTFFENWLTFYVLSLFVVLPIFLLVFPKINSFVNKYFKDKHLVIQGFAFVLPMMSVMFSLMTGLSVYVLMNFESVKEYFELYGMEIHHNIPMFLTFALIMGGIVKPLIAKRKQKTVRVKD